MITETTAASVAAEEDERAAEIAADLPAKFAERADAEHERAQEWYSLDSCRRLVAMIRTGSAHSPAARTVIAEVSGTDEQTHADIATWGYVAAEVLDEVAATYRLPDSALITDEGPGRYRLTW
ncbi:hypothetical protein [Nocardia salmonicida]|uniref:hypothetical protein n=1 Tax=Nocardia salmonicida TaxID=53431 RepID=UPI0033C66660